MFGRLWAIFLFFLLFCHFYIYLHAYTLFEALPPLPPRDIFLKDGWQVLGTTSLLLPLSAAWDEDGGLQLSRQ
jgi:hypothetical protein